MEHSCAAYAQQVADIANQRTPLVKRTNKKMALNAIIKQANRIIALCEETDDVDPLIQKTNITNHVNQLAKTVSDL